MSYHPVQVHWSTGDSAKESLLQPAVMDGTQSSESTVKYKAGVGDDLAVEVRDDEFSNYQKKSSLRWRIGSFNPDWIQFLTGPKCFLGVLCLFTFVQSFPSNGLFVVNTTSLERRYGFSSEQIGLISGTYDLAAGFAILPISFYGNKGHKPRWLAAAASAYAIGSFLSAAPHFLSSQLYDGSRINGSLIETCSITEREYAPTETWSSYLYLFLFAQVLHGLGGITLLTLGTVFIGENVRTYDSPLYISLLYAAATIATACGFLLGSYFISIYVDVTAPTPPFGQESPKWVGAWWLGYTFNSALAVVVTLLLAGYPHELPCAAEARVGRCSEAHVSEGTLEASAIPNFGRQLKDVPRMLKLLVSNPVFVCVTLAGVCGSLAKGGIAAFVVQFVQNQFNKTASWSSLLVGFVVIPGALLGSFLGGFIPKKLKLKVPGLLRFCMVGSALLMLFTPVFWAHCDTPIVFGSGGKYLSGSSSSSSGLPDTVLTADCNRNCHCSVEHYAPVCGADQRQYFSPCHAGCQTQGMYVPASSHASDTTTSPEDETKLVFYSCACIEPLSTTAVPTTTQASLVDVVNTSSTVTAPTRSPLSPSSSSTTGSESLPSGPSTPPASSYQAVDGACDTECDLLYAIFLPGLLLMIVCGFVELSPWTTLTLRCVPESQTTFGLGVMWVFVRLLGFAPGAVMFGSIVDASCVVWKEGASGEKSSCWVYDNYRLSQNFFLMAVCLKAASVVLYWIALRLYKPPSSEQQAAEIVSNANVII